MLAAGGAWDSVFTVPYVAEVAPEVLARVAAITVPVGSVIAILPAPTGLRLLVLLVGTALLARAATRPR